MTANPHVPSVINDAVSMTTEEPSNPADASTDEVRYMSTSEALQVHMSQIQKLPAKKRWPFDLGPFMLAINAGLVGVISNSFFRRMLMVRKGLLLSSLPMALMPALVLTPAWMHYVTSPILLGDLKCGICTEVRGGLLNFALGAMYPVAWQRLSAAMATRYKTVVLPSIEFKTFDRRKFINFWMGKSRYFRTQFITISIFQFCFGMYIAGSQFGTVQKEKHAKLIKA